MKRGIIVDKVVLFKVYGEISQVVGTFLACQKYRSFEIIVRSVDGQDRIRNLSRNNLIMA